ncbi:MAG: PDZ domain-containing protein [Planctomycetes bacterium]|nr:PDZ domain-containing protein [Planctomycetota bacterium]
MSTLTAAMFPLLLLSPLTDPWLGIYFDMEREAAVVGERIPGSPAEKAGIEAGDVLLGVDAASTPTREAFVAAIRAHRAGDTITVRARRGGQDLSFTVVLGERPRAAVPGAESPQAPPRSSEPPAPVAELRPAAPPPARGYLGLRVQETQAGIFIESALPGSPAALAGVRAGERLLAVGDQRVASLADLERVLQRARAGQTLSLSLLSADGPRSLGVTLALVGGAAKAAGVPAASGAPAAPVGSQGREADLEQELAVLRAELADLRRQLEALRRGARE